MRVDFDQLPDCVAIVGSRSWAIPIDDISLIMLMHVKRFVTQLREGTEVVSGGAEGIDQWAVRHAEGRGLPIKEYFPDRDILGFSKFFIRNSEIVEHVRERHGVVVAFKDIN